MSGFTAQANFSFNTPGQQVFIDTIGERETAEFNDPNNPRANVKPVQSHVSLILRKLAIIILLIFIAIFGVMSTAIGAIAYVRNCHLPREPSIPIWLLVIGGMSILLAVVLAFLILVSTTCKYKSSNKKFRIAFIITIGIVTALFGWADAPGTQAAFNLPDKSKKCLGFIYEYSIALYFIMIICSLICVIYAIYKNRHRCCCGVCNKNKDSKIRSTHLIVVNQAGVVQAIPLDRCIQQLVPLPNTVIETTPVKSKSELPSYEDVLRGTRKEETLFKGAPTDIRLDMTSTEKASVDIRTEATFVERANIEMNS